MKAISIKNPYATQIMRGTKIIEYRSWDTKHRGDLLICSSADPKVPGMLSGYALCIVNLVDTIYNAAEAVYEWHLTDVRKIKAFPVKGKLNFFDVDDALIHYPGEKAVEEQEETPIPQPTVQTAIPQMPGMPKMIDNINLEIKLTQPQLDEAVLRQIDKEIPYHILFVLSYGNKVQAWTGYKEAAESGKKAFKVNKYYHTEWMLEDELILDIEGLNMDAVWDNFIIQIGGVELEQGNDLAEQIAVDERKEKLIKEIEKLEKQARNEKQPNKKFELAQKVKALKEKLNSP